MVRRFTEIFSSSAFEEHESVLLILIVLMNQSDSDEGLGFVRAVRKRRTYQTSPGVRGDPGNI